MNESERLEARGPRGEACIIIRSWTRSVADAEGRQEAHGPSSFRLASGERLNTTDDAKVFETLDKSRRFTLR